MYVSNLHLWSFPGNNVKITVIRALDFESKIEARDAARKLLSVFHTMDPNVDMIVHTKVEHEGLYQELGWLSICNIDIKDTSSLGPDPYILRTYLRPAGMIAPNN